MTKKIALFAALTLLSGTVAVGAVTISASNVTIAKASDNKTITWNGGDFDYSTGSLNVKDYGCYFSGSLSEKTTPSFLTASEDDDTVTKKADFYLRNEDNDLYFSGSISVTSSKSTSDFNPGILSASQLAGLNWVTFCTDTNASDSYAGPKCTVEVSFNLVTPKSISYLLSASGQRSNVSNPKSSINDVSGASATLYFEDAKVWASTENVNCGSNYSELSQNFGDSTSTEGHYTLTFTFTDCTMVILKSITSNCIC